MAEKTTRETLHQMGRDHTCTNYTGTVGLPSHRKSHHRIPHITHTRNKTSHHRPDRKSNTMVLQHQRQHTMSEVQIPNTAQTLPSSYHKSIHDKTGHQKGILDIASQTTRQEVLTVHPTRTDLPIQITSHGHETFTTNLYPTTQTSTKTSTPTLPRLDNQLLSRRPSTTTQQQRHTDNTNPNNHTNTKQLRLRHQPTKISTHTYPTHTILGGHDRHKTNATELATHKHRTDEKDSKKATKQNTHYQKGVSITDRQARIHTPDQSKHSTTYANIAHIHASTPTPQMGHTHTQQTSHRESDTLDLIRRGVFQIQHTSPQTITNRNRCISHRIWNHHTQQISQHHRPTVSSTHIQSPRTDSNMSGNPRGSQTSSSLHHTNTHRQHHSRSILEKTKRTQTTFTQDSSRTTNNTTAKTTTTGTNTQTRHTHAYTRPTVAKTPQPNRLDTGQNILPNNTTKTTNPTCMGSVCQPTESPEQTIHNMGTSPSQQTLGCTTHRLDTTTRDTVCIPTISLTTTDFTENTFTSETNHTNTPTLVHIQLDETIPQHSSLHIQPGQTTEHTILTQTLHEEQHTLHTEDTSPTTQLDTGLNHFLLLNRPDYAEDDSQWHILTTDLKNKNYEKKWRVYNKFCVKYNIPPLTYIYNSQQNRQLTQHFTELTTSQINDIKQIRSALIPLLTEEHTYYARIQALIAQSKPVSELFTVRGDEYDILHQHITNMLTPTDQLKRLQAIGAFMLDTGSRCSDMRAIDHRTFHINDKNNLQFKFAYDGLHTTKEAKHFKSSSLHRRRKYSNLIELTAWASSIIISYWKHIQHKLTNEVGFFTCTNNKKSYISGQTIKNQIELLINSTELKNRKPKITPHKLKHIVTSKWKTLGWDIHYIADRTRTNIKTIETYYITDNITAKE